MRHPADTASADSGDPASARASRAAATDHRDLSRGCRTRCLFGLLGPDAIEIAYQTSDHHLHIERTVGADGAYLVVERHDPHNEP
jgi:hypothetical protein